MLCYNHGHHFEKTFTFTDDISKLYKEIKTVTGINLFKLLPLIQNIFLSYLSRVLVF